MAKKRVRNNKVPKPKDIEKAASAAYMRILGATQAVAAAAAGIGKRTLERYEHQEWWPEVETLATNQWLSGLKSKAMTSILKLVDSKDPLVFDSVSVRWVLDRLFPELQPPSQKVELTGRDGKPIQTEGNLTINLERLEDNEVAALDRLINKTNSIAHRLRPTPN